MNLNSTVLRKHVIKYSSFNCLVLLGLFSVFGLVGCDGNMQDSESEILAKVEQKIGKVNNSPWLYFNTENEITVNKNGKYSEGFKVGRWSYTSSSGREQRYINWSVYNRDSVKLNFPADWKVEPKTKSVFYADIPPQSSSYFTVLSKGDTVAQTASEYFGFLYSAVANDTSEQLTSATARLLRQKKEVIFTSMSLSFPMKMIVG